MIIEVPHHNNCNQIGFHQEILVFSYDSEVSDGFGGFMLDHIIQNDIRPMCKNNDCRILYIWFVINEYIKANPTLKRELLKYIFDFFTNENDYEMEAVIRTYCNNLQGYWNMYKLLK